MNLIEFYPAIFNGLTKLVYHYDYVSTNGATPYKATSVDELRRQILRLKDVPYIEPEIQTLLSSWIFETASDTQFITSNADTELKGIIDVIKQKLSVLKDIVDRSGMIGKEDLLFVKLPELDTFDDLAKISNEFKKSHRNSHNG